MQINCSENTILFLLRTSIGVSHWRTMFKAKKTTKGKQRIEMKKRENKDARYISFSKRGNGVFVKASELSTLCSADLAANSIPSVARAWTRS